MFNVDNRAQSLQYARTHTVNKFLNGNGIVTQYHPQMQTIPFIIASKKHRRKKVSNINDDELKGAVSEVALMKVPDLTALKFLSENYDSCILSFIDIIMNYQIQ